MRRAGVLGISALLLAACGQEVAPDEASTGSIDMTRAVRLGDLQAVQTALQSGADVDARQAFGATPLALAVDTQNAAMVAALLDAGGDPDAADDDGATPLTLACELGGDAITAALLDAGADVNLARPDGLSPLAVCAGYSSPAIVERMIALGAEVDHADERGRTPMMYAAASGNAEAIRMLAEAGADPNRVSDADFTPLFFAIKSKTPAATEAVLAAGGSDDHIGPKDTSAAQLAVYQDNFPALAVLVERGADVAALDRHGYSLLHAAAAAGEADVAELLIAKGADVDQLTGPSTLTYVTEANFGQPPAVPPLMPPLMIAAKNGHADIMEALLAAGADPSFVTESDDTLLHAAASGHDPAALELALQFAPDVNAANGAGATPLHLVMLRDSGDPVDGDFMEPMLRLLESHGARMDIPDGNGNSAMVLGLEGLDSVRAKFIRAFGLPEDARATTSIAGAFVVTRETEPGEDEL